MLYFVALDTYSKSRRENIMMQVDGYKFCYHKLLTYSSDFGAAHLDPCENRTVVPYTYTLRERSAKLHATFTKSRRITPVIQIGKYKYGRKYDRTENSMASFDSRRQQRVQAQRVYSARAHR
ncbi:hypothetical protein EVAR_17903_1 [Eumeta japonica]|uniref:Uncharacterized protein n=1 Tax=Eumeta variegata TaxID=151549 RepID=A0A4C1V045_EUMVA|nr:hypothetical protein EVAR_17903_1 [Eumeta japonica]